MAHQESELYPFATLVYRQRQGLSLSQRELAQRMNEAAEHDGTHGGATRQTIHEYEAPGNDGWPRIPRPDSLRWLASGLELPLAQLVTAAEQQRQRRRHARHQDEASATALLGFPASLSDAIALALALWGDDMRRRDFLAGTPFVVAATITPGWRWLYEPGDQQVTRVGGPRVHAADVERIQADVQTFAAMDQRHGGGHLRWMVSTYLHREVAPLLHGSYTDRTGRELFALASLLTRRAGMMAYDCSRHGLAQRYFVQALRLAHAADNRALGAHVLVSMSHQAIDLGHPSEAVQLALAAHDGASASAPSSLLAKIAVMEARAHAKLHDTRACTSALSRAETTFDRANPQHDPAWIQSANEPYLRCQFGLCHLDLDQPRQAARHLGASLAGQPAEHVRRRTMATALLARAHLDQHDLEQACAVGADAIDLALRLKSQRSLNCIRDLQRGLTPHKRRAPVREFIEKAATLLQAV